MSPIRRHRDVGGLVAPAQRVSVSRLIDAPPGAIFDVLADPALHPQIDGSGTVRAARGAPDRLVLGSRFGMDMRWGLPYFVRNTVVELQEGRLIAWRHVMGSRWRYQLEPVGAATRVTETFDWSTAHVRRPLELAGFPTRNAASMLRTLDRLAALVEPAAARAEPPSAEPA